MERSFKNSVSSRLEALKNLGRSSTSLGRYPENHSNGISITSAFWSTVVSASYHQKVNEDRAITALLNHPAHGSPSPHKSVHHHDSVFAPPVVAPTSRRCSIKVETSGTTTSPWLPMSGRRLFINRYHHLKDVHHSSRDHASGSRNRAPPALLSAPAAGRVDRHCRSLTRVGFSRRNLEIRPANDTVKDSPAEQE